jgi:uncharacterized coiled-coil DUF342 family protein
MNLFLAILICILIVLIYFCITKAAEPPRPRKYRTEPIFRAMMALHDDPNINGKNYHLVEYFSGEEKVSREVDRLEEMYKELDKKKQQYAQIENDYNTRADEYQEIYNRLEEIKEAREELTQSIEELSAEYEQKYQDEYTVLNTEQTELTEKNTNLTKLYEDIQSLQANISNRSSRKSELEQENKAEKEYLLQQISVRAELLSKINQAESLLSETNEQVNKTQAEIDSLKKEIDTYTQNLKSEQIKIVAGLVGNISLTAILIPISIILEESVIFTLKSIRVMLTPVARLIGRMSPSLKISMGLRDTRLGRGVANLSDETIESMSKLKRTLKSFGSSQTASLARTIKNSTRLADIASKVGTGIKIASAISKVNPLTIALFAFEAVSIGLDIADVMGYGEMPSGRELKQISDAIDVEYKKILVNYLETSLGDYRDELVRSINEDPNLDPDEKIFMEYEVARIDQTQTARVPLIGPLSELSPEELKTLIDQNIEAKFADTNSSIYRDFEADMEARQNTYAVEFDKFMEENIRELSQIKFEQYFGESVSSPSAAELGEYMNYLAQLLINIFVIIKFEQFFDKRAFSIIEESIENICLNKGGQYIEGQCSYNNQGDCHTRTYDLPLKTYEEACREQGGIWENGECRCSRDDQEGCDVESGLLNISGPTIGKWNPEKRRCEKYTDAFIRYCTEDRGFIYDQFNHKCYIPPDLCQVKGGEYRDNDCHIPVEQSIAELLSPTGTTITRALIQVFDSDQYCPCPSGNYLDMGMSCLKTRPTIIRSFRSFALRSSNCNPGERFFAGVCFSACPSGYSDGGPLCFQKCPGGFAETGLNCFKPRRLNFSGKGSNEIYTDSCPPPNAYFTQICTREHFDKVRSGDAVIEYSCIGENNVIEDILSYYLNQMKSIISQVSPLNQNMILIINKDAKYVKAKNICIKRGRKGTKSDACLETDYAGCGDHLSGDNKKYTINDQRIQRCYEKKPHSVKAKNICTKRNNFGNCTETKNVGCGDHLEGYKKDYKLIIGDRCYIEPKCVENTIPFIYNNTIRGCYNSRINKLRNITITLIRYISVSCYDFIIFAFNFRYFQHHDYINVLIEKINTFFGFVRVFFNYIIKNNFMSDKILKQINLIKTRIDNFNYDQMSYIQDGVELIKRYDVFSNFSVGDPYMDPFEVLIEDKDSVSDLINIIYDELKKHIFTPVKKIIIQMANSEIDKLKDQFGHEPYHLLFSSTFKYCKEEFQALSDMFNKLEAYYRINSEFIEILTLKYMYSETIKTYLDDHKKDRVKVYEHNETQQLEDCIIL